MKERKKRRKKGRKEKPERGGVFETKTACFLTLTTNILYTRKSPTQKLW